MASKTVGIQQLLSSEKTAAELIGEARRRKNKRLKAAKDEAAVEVEQYRQEREVQFAEYEDVHLGNKADIAARIESDTQAQLKDMTISVEEQKEGVLTMLMETIADIHAVVHKNLQAQ